MKKRKIERITTTTTTTTTITTIIITVIDDDGRKSNKQINKRINKTRLMADHRSSVFINKTKWRDCKIKHNQESLFYYLRLKG